jgi:BON domain-containing protein
MVGTRSRAPVGPVLLITLSLALSGCVLVIGDEDPGRDSDVEWIGDRDGRSDSRSAHRHAASASGSQDRALREQLTEALADEPLIADQNLTITVSDGDVTVHGEVRDLAAFDRVVEIVTTTEGVGQVISRLVVRIR